MSTSTSSSSTSSPEDQAEQQQRNINNAYTSFKHNAALALLIGAPILIAIPPRKLDLYTFALSGAFVASANQICRERTGRGLLSQFGYQYVNKTNRNSADESNAMRIPGTFADKYPIRRNDNDGTAGSILQEKAKEVWRGGQPSDWKERRLKEEQEKLDNGEGYGDMIADQIWDVWNQKKEGDAEATGDERDTKG